MSTVVDIRILKVKRKSVLRWKYLHLSVNRKHILIYCDNTIPSEGVTSKGNANGFYIRVLNYRGMWWHRGRGTALQTRRSLVRFLMVSLEFFIDIILPGTLWPWG